MPIDAAVTDWRKTVQIVHHAVPGRVRLHVKGLKRSADLKSQLVQRLARWGDVSGAWPNIDTGNVLVLFDPAVPTQSVAVRVARAARGHSLGEADDPQKDEAWHQCEVEQVARELRTSLQSGLSSEAATDRLAQSGLNRVPPPSGRARLEILAGQFHSLPVVLLMAAGTVSLLTGGLADAVAIFGVVALNASIGYTVESRSEKTIRLLRREDSVSATVVRDRARLELPADRLVPGDILLLARGDTVAADARIWRADDLLADEAILTGEESRLFASVRMPCREVP